LNNIIEHPWRRRRIDQAKAAVFENLRHLDRSDISSIRQSCFDDLITTAVVHELEIPGSSVAALEQALHDGAAPGQDRRGARGRRGPIKIGKRG